MDAIRSNLSWAAEQPPHQFVSEHKSVAIYLFLGLVAIIAYSTSWKRCNEIPLVGEELGNADQRRKAYRTDSRSLYRKGYEQFKNTAYRVTGSEGDDHIVVPMSDLDELRKLPDEVLNMQVAMHKRFEGQFTMPKRINGKFLVHTVRQDLTRRLNSLNPRLAPECERSVIEEVGPCDDWTPLAAYGKFVRIIAIVSGAIFIGSDLCRQEEYLDASINFTTEFFGAIRRLKAWKPWMRPLVAPFLREIQILKATRSRTEKFLRPIIRQRRAMKAADHDLPEDMLQWMLNKADAWDVSDEMLSETQLQLNMAAIHTTTQSIIHLLYDLAIRPNVIEDLRNEIETVLDESNGNCTAQALFQMKLLDSVMRESQRINKMAEIRYQNVARAPITLSSGITIPAGTTIEAPYGSIVEDPAIYTDPDEFDAYRFLKLRSGEVPDRNNYRTTEQYQFVSVTKEHMAFGFGRHACPGRFFASNEIKLILIQLLLNYDFRMPDGKTERYSNIRSDHSIIADPTRTLEFKRRI